MEYIQFFLSELNSSQESLDDAAAAALASLTIPEAMESAKEFSIRMR